jgi:hypothetical protein
MVYTVLYTILLFCIHHRIYLRWFTTFGVVYTMGWYIPWGGIYHGAILQMIGNELWANDHFFSLCRVSWVDLGNLLLEDIKGATRTGLGTRLLIFICRG